MQIQIHVLSVNINHIPNAKGGYDMAEIAYKDVKDGKVNGKKIMSFVDKGLFESVKGLVSGSQYDVEMLKEPGRDGKEYWQWKKITPTTGAPVANDTKTGYAAPKSTYETPEERKLKQEFIIRQSSISSAISLLKTEKNTPSKEEVVAVASFFVDFVYNKPEPFADLPNDIPE